jgi:hypothetical protein
MPTDLAYESGLRKFKSPAINKASSLLGIVMLCFTAVGEEAIEDDKQNWGIYNVQEAAGMFSILTDLVRGLRKSKTSLISKEGVNLCFTQVIPLLGKRP